MESPVPLSRRIAILAGLFFFILLSGVLSLHTLGGATESLAEDFYLVLSLFGLEGGWVFESPSNFYLKILVFVAPLFTILGIIEIFTRRAITFAVQLWSLFWSSDHVVILGLSQDSLLLIRALRKSKKKVTVIDKSPAPLLASRCRRLGVPVIEADPTGNSGLKKARLTRAAIAVSFISDVAEAVSVVFSADKLLRREGKKPIDLWLNIDEVEFGRRLGDYLKFAGLSDLIHPRFFNLNEVAARHLVRKYPPDIYADVLGQERLHLAVYGFGNFAFEVIEEYLLQTTSLFRKRPKISILSDAPEKSEARLKAFCPEIELVADVAFEKLDVYATGIANRDYGKIPKDVTAHLVCYGREKRAAATALSLRSLLLSKPSEARKGEARRLNAPIFVRLSQRKGIAQLLRSHVIDPGLKTGQGQTRGDIPDGIFAFGVKEDYLSIDQDDPLVPTVIDNSREKAAKYLHFSYVRDKTLLSDATGDVARDWEVLGPRYRESCRQEADHIWAKARLVRHRLLPKKRKGEVPESTLSREEQEKIAIAEHQRWMIERQLAGWRYHKRRVEEARRHDLLRPWSKLSAKEARLDLKLAEKINAAAAEAGLEFKRELVIGVVGHRLSPGRDFDEGHVKKELRREISKLLEKHPERAPVILTHLADGADTVAGEVALEMGIPFVVPLPLPFETYCRDFEENGGHQVEKFLDLISLADSYFEIPLKFGDLVGLAKEKKSGAVSGARARQYALGGAYIVERSDELIAVWDGKKARGTGGTADVVQWRQEGRVPKEFQSPDYFARHVPLKPAIIIRPTP